ncbi:MAG TPA: hypothetical protein VGB53_06650 [Rubricoccaceae bacterium]|jgi:hypothetical protein
MPTLLTPEHFQLLSTRRLTEAVAPTEPSDEGVVPTAGSARLAQMARFELRRRAGQVPVRNRYASVTLRRRVGGPEDTAV